MGKAFDSIKRGLNEAIANAEMCSIPQQVAYRAKVGWVVLDNPDLPIEFVRDVVVAMDEESGAFYLPEA